MPNYPILVKLGIKDYHPEGKSVSDGIEPAKILEAAGLDALEVSEGIEADWSLYIRINAMNPYYIDECRQVKEALSIPVILVGGMRKLKDMQAIEEYCCSSFFRDCIVYILHNFV